MIRFCDVKDPTLETPRRAQTSRWLFDGNTKANKLWTYKKLSQFHEKKLTIPCQIIKSIHDLNLWFMFTPKRCHLIQHQSGVTCRMINWRNPEKSTAKKSAEIKWCRFKLKSPRFLSDEILLRKPHVLISCQQMPQHLHCRSFKCIWCFAASSIKQCQSISNVQVGDENYAIRNSCDMGKCGKFWWISSWTIYWWQLKLVVAAVEACDDHDKSNHCSN